MEKRVGKCVIREEKEKKETDQEEKRSEKELRQKYIVQIIYP